MSTINAFLDEGARAKSRRRRLIIGILLGVLALHLAVGVIAGAIVVAKYFFPPAANFEIKKDIRLPAKQREHKMNMAAFDALAPKPTFHDKMQSLRPAAFALPDLPKLPLDQMLPLDPSEIVSDQVANMVGPSGLGAVGQSAGGSAGLGAGMSFFGIESTGQRILLLFDVSSSVVNKADAAGVPLSKIRSETAALVAKLPISARFGIIQFTRNYKAFRTELVPATDQNRADAREWIDEEWVESGMMAASGKVTSNPTGLVGVLELAAEMQPDVIFLISDGSFQWRPPPDPKSKKSGSSFGSTIPWKEIDKAAMGPLQGAQGCKIHFIGFEIKPADKREFGAIVRKTGGKIREIK